MTPTLDTTQTSRRIVLVDFDWHDADLLPALIRHPGVSVRLVAGSSGEDPGVRVAELCGLPRTLDLADLTREIFDLALVSERSPRRTQIESLLRALGTPCVAPLDFIEGRTEGELESPAIEAPLALHAAAFESTLGGDDFEAIVEHALPDVGPDAPTAPQPVQSSGTPRFSIGTLDDFPSPEDRHGLEAALLQLISDTGAHGAEIYSGRASHVERVAQVGGDDALLRGLVELALHLGTAQVVTPLAGPGEGKAWGAWPFRTTLRRGVVAAAAIDPAGGWTAWERTVEELRNVWERHDREQAAPAFPLIPEGPHGWFDAEMFHAHVEMAVGRHRRDGMRFALHRLEFPDTPAAIDRLCEHLPEQLRETDFVSRPAPHEVLLLRLHVPAALESLRRRLFALWERAWIDDGREAPAPAIEEQHIELLAPEDADAFLATASRWLRETPAE